MTAKTAAEAPTGDPILDHVASGFEQLRAAFPPEQVHHLPKSVIGRDQQKTAPKGTCEDTPQGRQFSVDRIYCGAYHNRSMHISYVGHADVTNRFLEVDPRWNWEPMAFDPNGLPLLDRDGGLWIRLTILGVTRPAYGDAPGKSGAMKELIGDALRNGGMRFGVALDLWSKSDLHATTVAEVAREWLDEAAAKGTSEEMKAVWREAQANDADADTLDKIVVMVRERIEAEREMNGA